MTGPIERHSARITISDTTTLDQLKTFTQQMGQNEKLRGIKNNDGTITLYATDKKASLLDKMSGKASERSQVGRDAISTVMRGVLANNPEALTHVTQLTQLIGANTNRSAKTDTLSQMVGLMQKPPVDTPTLSQLPNGGQGVKTAITSLANRLDQLANAGTIISTSSTHGPVITDQGLKQEIQNLAQALAQALSDPQTAQNFPNLALTKDGALLDDLMSTLRNQLGGMLETAIGVDVVATIGKQAVEFGLGSLLPNQFNTDGTLTVNGQLYDKGRDLGDGAYGKVVEYVPRNGGDPVAVKFMKHGGTITPSQVFDMAVQENDSQQKANGTGDPNVLKGHGLARVGDGTLAIITEIATRGDGMKLMDNNKSSVTKGDLTPRQGMLTAMTLAKDMAKGLAHMHSQGIAHIDFKPMNVFIDENGVGKVADFGTGTESRVGTRQIFAPIDAPYWQSPEVLAGKNNSQKSDVKFSDLQQEALSKLSDLFANEVTHGGNAPQTFVLNQSLIDQVAEDLEQTQLDTQFDGGKIDPQAYDSFALGVCIFNSFFESTLVPGGKNQFVFEDEKALSEFYAKGIDPIGNHPGALHQTTGFPEVDDLINQLMKSDPQKRMTVTQALNSNAFNDPQIGSNDVRDLMVALTTGDDAKILLASLLV